MVKVKTAAMLQSCGVSMLLSSFEDSKTDFQCKSMVHRSTNCRGSENQGEQKHYMPFEPFSLLHINEDLKKIHGCQFYLVVELKCMSIDCDDSECTCIFMSSAQALFSLVSHGLFFQRYQVRFCNYGRLFKVGPTSECLRVFFYAATLLKTNGRPLATGK